MQILRGMGRFLLGAAGPDGCGPSCVCRRAGRGKQPAGARAGSSGSRHVGGLVDRCANARYSPCASLEEGTMRSHSLLTGTFAVSLLLTAVVASAADPAPSAAAPAAKEGSKMTTGKNPIVVITT